MLSALRTPTFVLNLLIAVFFGSFIGYTYYARQHLESLARSFVTEKTMEYSGPLVDVADESLASPLVQKLLTAKQSATIGAEIKRYRNNPRAYIEDLTRTPHEKLVPLNGNPLLAKVATIKQGIRTFYETTLNALLFDLRLFSFSNLAAALLALALGSRAPSDRNPFIVVSFVMLVSVLYCTLLYIDNLTFFRILSRSHMGWWYPILLVTTIYSLWYSIGRGDAARGGEAPST